MSPSIQVQEHNPRALVTLEVLLALLVVGAIQGGAAMVANPSEPLGMSTRYLEGTPIGTYLWAGIFLLCIAAASLLTLSGLVWRWEWPWARAVETRLGHRWPWPGVVATAGLLLSFEVVELFVVPFHPVMYPLLIGWCVVILALALTSSVRAHLTR